MRLVINNDVTVGSTTSEPTATLFVFATGSLRGRIIAVAEPQVSLDPIHRRLAVRAETNDGPPAMVRNDRTGMCVFLDEWRATTAAWIEDAFLQTLRAASAYRCLPANFSFMSRPIASMVGWGLMPASARALSTSAGFIVAYRLMMVSTSTGR